MEIFLLKRLTDVDGVIQLVEFFETPDHFVLILERPDPVKDVFDYVSDEGSLPEDTARHLFVQAVEILRRVQEKGVFHRDVKDDNLIIDPSSMEVRLIDFGCGTLLGQKPYSKFYGEEGTVRDIFSGHFFIRRSFLYSLVISLFTGHFFIHWPFFIHWSFFIHRPFLIHRSFLYSLVISLFTVHLNI